MNILIPRNILRANKTFEIRLKKSTVSPWADAYRPAIFQQTKLQEFLKLRSSEKRLRGIFAIYKPPHQHMRDLQQQIEDTILGYVRTNEDKLPKMELLSIKNNSLSITNDDRHNSKIETDQDRLARLGLSVSYFPETSFQSSGLVFITIGSEKTPIKELIMEVSKFGQKWRWTSVLGITR